VPSDWLTVDLYAECLLPLAGLLLAGLGVALGYLIGRQAGFRAGKRLGHRRGLLAAGRIATEEAAARADPGEMAGGYRASTCTPGRTPPQGGSGTAPPKGERWLI
jgi:hypothetical protein